MRRRLFLVMIAALHIVALSQATDEALPPCTTEEFVAIFELIAEQQVDAALDLQSFNDLLRYSGAQLSQRATVHAGLPPCADGVEAHQLLLSLGTDIVARNALDLANLPAAENPYRQQLATDQERIEALSQAMLNRDRASAPSPQERRSPACADAEMSLIVGLATEFLAAMDEAEAITNLPLYVQSVARRLAWRKANLPRLPACAEAIPLALLLNRASTDAAAHHALAFAGVSQQTNPYDDLEVAALAELRIWLQLAQLTQAGAESDSTSVTGRLPACTQSELAAAYASLQPTYAQLRPGYGYADEAAARLALSLDHVQSRVSIYRELPGCAEAIHAGWWLAQALSDAALQSAFAGKNAQVADFHGASSVAAAASMSRLESLLGAEQSAATAPRRGAPTCRDPQRVYFNVYIMPAFHRFTEAALATATAADLAQLVDEAGGLRDLLWEQLPRCDAALEVGWLMRRVAADFLAMLALESAGAAPRDIPYVSAIVEDMAAIHALLEDFNADTFYAAGLIYYVIADGFANLRSCGSTECAVVGMAQRGDILRVLDDSGDWLKLQLGDGGTAWIAGFLASETPP